MTVAIDSPCPNLKARKSSTLPALQDNSTTGLPLSGQMFVIKNQSFESVSTHISTQPVGLSPCPGYLQCIIKRRTVSQGTARQNGSRAVSQNRLGLERRLQFNGARLLEKGSKVKRKNTVEASLFQRKVVRICSSHLQYRLPSQRFNETRTSLLPRAKVLIGCSNAPPDSTVIQRPLQTVATCSSPSLVCFLLLNLQKSQ